MIVGRSGQLSTLGQVLDAAESGRSASVLLVGDPGMGTSTLLDAAASSAAARGWLVVRLAAPEGSIDAAFAVVHDLLWGLDEPAEHRVTGRRDRPRGALASGRSVAAVAETLRDLLEERAAARPLLIGLDDLQWVDDSSRGSLSLALGRLPAARLAMVAAGCPPADRDPRFLGWQRLDVGALDEIDAVDLLWSVLPDPPDLAQSRRIVQALGCCPEALMQCRRLLTPEQIDGSGALPEPLPLDEHLRHALLAASSDLPERTREALLWLAVLDTADVDLVRDVLAQTACSLDDLQPALDAGFLTEGPHAVPSVKPLVRAALTQGTPAQDLRAAHRRVADTAERLGASPAVLVRHLRNGADPGDEDAIRRIEREARRAQQRDQPDVAAHSWEAAATLTIDPRRRTERTRRAAETWLMECSSVDGGDRLLSLLSTGRLTEQDEVWRQWLHAEVLATHDLQGSAVATLVAARHARDAQPRLVPWLLWTCVTTAWIAGDPELALDAARDLTSWVTTPGRRPDSAAPGWLAPAVLGAALVQAGHVDQGAALLAEARSASASWQALPRTRLGELVAVVSLDELMAADGPERDARLHELTLRLHDDPGATLAAALVMQAARARRRGDWSAAGSLAGEALELAAAVRAPTEEASSLVVLADLAAKTGSPQLVDLCSRLRRLAAGAGDHRARAGASYATGLAALVDGRVDDAVAALEPLGHTRFLGRGIGDSPLAGRVALVEAYVRAGENNSAATLVDRLVPVLDGLGDPDATAAAKRCRGLVSPMETAGLLREALAEHENGRDSFEGARTRLLLGEHLRRAHRLTEARHELARAAEGFESLGAAPWRALAAAERRAGEIQPQGTSDRLGILTPQERRVAEFVAQGASNREVARAMMLSPRTVEFHLASAFRKLGVPSRTALARLVSTYEVASPTAPMTSTR